MDRNITPSGFIPTHAPKLFSSFPSPSFPVPDGCLSGRQHGFRLRPRAAGSSFPQSGSDSRPYTSLRGSAPQEEEEKTTPQVRRLKGKVGAVTQETGTKRGETNVERVSSSSRSAKEAPARDVKYSRSCWRSYAVSGGSLIPLPPPSDSAAG